MLQQSVFDPLLKTFDCFGWIPTIRGSLSLDLLTQKLLLGDTDKYLIEFQEFQNFESSRYIVGSSLISYSDRKHFSLIRSRAFRFFFHGTIGDKHEIEAFKKKFSHCEGLSKLLEDKELLIGQLSIVLNLSKKLNDDEALALKNLSLLQKQKEKYQDLFVTEAAPLEVLSKQRELLKNRYNTFRSKLQRIEDSSEDNSDFRVWKFDVVLSRDGLLFLRNDTNDAYLNDFYKENTAKDYKKNMQLHRIFKIAMIYVKYMFHKHYHHDNNNDSFLPVINLHPHSNATKQISKRIINQQLEKFLQQITKYKRIDKNLKSNPIGISCYAKSFVDILSYNELLSPRKRRVFQRFIANQESEAKIYLKDIEKSSDFFFAQNNFIAALTVGISFVLLAVSILRFYFFTEAEKESVFSQDARILLIASAFILGFMLQKTAVKIKLNKVFSSSVSNKNKKLLRFLFKKSNLEKKRLSYPYTFYLWLTEIMLKLSKVLTEILVFIFGFIFLLLVLFAAVTLLL